MKKTSGLLVFFVLACLSGCVHHKNLNLTDANDGKRTVVRSDENCLELIKNLKPYEGVSYPGSIRLLSWNVEKGKHENWKDEFSNLSVISNLIILQEAVLNENTMLGTQEASFVSFSPGYARGQTVSGVATYSNTKPLVECHLTSTEPVLRTAKATNITLHSVAGREESLLVVNVHGINFSLGLGEFSRQMRQIEVIVDQHNGPVIVGGDFNTWRPKRVEYIQELTQRLRLNPVEFNQDHRTVYFGNVVDQIYIRGLTVKSSEIVNTDSSDHNPLIVELEL